MLDLWIKGDHSFLKKQIKQNTLEENHKIIDDFFINNQIIQNNDDIIQTQSDLKTDVFSFRLSNNDARMLRALAEIEGCSVTDLIANHVSEFVNKKMIDVAKSIVEKQNDQKLN